MVKSDGSCDCPDGLTKQDDDCISNCDSDEYFDADSSSCMPCAHSCVSCYVKASDCIDCISILVKNGLDGLPEKTPWPCECEDPK